MSGERIRAEQVRRGDRVTFRNRVRPVRVETISYDEYRGSRRVELTGRLVARDGHAYGPMIYAQLGAYDICRREVTS